MEMPLKRRNRRAATVPRWLNLLLQDWNAAAACHSEFLGVLHYNRIKCGRSNLVHSYLKGDFPPKWNFTQSPELCVSVSINSQV